MKNILKEIKQLEVQEKRLKRLANQDMTRRTALDKNTPIAEKWPDQFIYFIWAVLPEVPEHLSPMDVPDANYFHYWSEEYDEAQKFADTYGGHVMPLYRDPDYSERWLLGFPPEDEEFDEDEFEDEDF